MPVVPYSTLKKLFAGILLPLGFACHSCAHARTSDETKNHLSKSDLENISFVDVGISHKQVCGLASSGSVYCWKIDNNSIRASGPGKPFVQISVGFRYVCGLTGQHELNCWRLKAPKTESNIRPSRELLTTIQKGLPTHKYKDVSAGLFHLCALIKNGQIDCWGENDSGQSNPPDARYTDISTGEYHTCGVTKAGHILCWGARRYFTNKKLENANRRTGANSQTFVKVSAGNRVTCGLTSEKEVQCWDRMGGTKYRPLPFEFRSVSVGRDFACGVRNNRSVFCWDLIGHFIGHGAREISSNSPEGKFLEIVVRLHQACGVTENGDIECWHFDSTTFPL